MKINDVNATACGIFLIVVGAVIGLCLVFSR